MAEKKMFATRINIEVFKRLKHLSVDKDISIGELVEEAVEDLLKKYSKKKGK